MIPSPDSSSQFDDLSTDLLIQIDRVCLEYEAQRRSAQPSIDVLLSQVPAMGRDVLRAELTAIDAFYASAERDAALARAVIGGTAHGHGSAGAVEAQPPAEPVHVGGYVIENVLGKSPTGVVYKARQLANNQTVALRILSRRADAAALKHFEQDLEASMQLRHPNILQILQFGKQRGQLFMAMEYVEGGSLAPRFTGTPQPPKEAAALVRTLARAVQYAHDRHITHRALKPSGILLATDGTPKITDFGLARLLQNVSDDTQMNLRLGDPAHMAPEQLSGEMKPGGPPVDIYALGAILFELLTGRPPFQAESVRETMDQVRRLQPTPPTTLQPNVPRRLEAVCLQCLQTVWDRWRLGRRLGPVPWRRAGSGTAAVKT